MMRVNLSINIIAMVNKTNYVNSSEPLPNYGPRFNWSTHDQSLLLGAFFWGFILTSLPGGMLAERWGGSKVAGYSLLLSTVLTFLTPYAATLHFWVIFSVRVVVGILAGVLYPANHCLIAKWAPPDEKGKFVSSLLGGTFGTVITWPLSGLIVEAWGWTWAFYLTAIISGVVVGLWFILVSDKPASHKTIDKSEVEYIEKSLGEVHISKKLWPPFKQVLTSPPFWALLLLHYGNTWGYHFSLTATPKFLSEVLGFDVSKTGFLSSVPHLARIILGFLFGSTSDIIRRRKLLSVTMIRKTFCIFSHILPGIFLLCLAYFGRDPYICVAIITLSMGFNGASTVTNLQNSQDLAPNYVGTIYGTINIIGVTPGFFSPMLVAYFTKNNNTIEEWLNVFYIAAAMYILSAIIFWIFGSGNVQPWNGSKKPDNETARQIDGDLNTKL